MEQTALNERQTALLHLLEANPERRFRLKEIAGALPEYYPAGPGTNFHNSTSRRVMTADIQYINGSDEVSGLILTGSAGAKMATEEEYREYIAAQYKAVFHRLLRTRKKEKKAGLHGQSTLFREVIRAFRG